MLEATGNLSRLRADQARAWLWSEVRERLLAGLRSDPAVQRLAPELEAEVVAGDLAPPLAAQRLLDAHRGDG
jgi:LAO/AO transport system kinase